MPIQLTHENAARISLVQRTINAQIKYVPDPEKYGRLDLWEIPDEEGDCEDYALAKLHRLMKMGYPREDLKITLCWDETGTYHAVLSVDTDAGVLILDNRFSGVRTPKSCEGYRWHKRERPGELYWEDITAWNQGR